MDIVNKSCENNSGMLSIFIEQKQRQFGRLDVFT